MEKLHKLIIRRFNYLITDFDYTIVETSSFLRAIYVKFSSQDCEIVVYIEGLYAGLTIDPLITTIHLEDEKDKRFELYDILNYIAPELNIVAKGAIFLDAELKRISSFFLTYCKDIIKGDFSIWPALIQKRYELRSQRE